MEAQPIRARQSARERATSRDSEPAAMLLDKQGALSVSVAKEKYIGFAVKIPRNVHAAHADQTRTLTDLQVV